MAREVLIVHKNARSGEVAGAGVCWSHINRPAYGVGGAGAGGVARPPPASMILRALA